MLDRFYFLPADYESKIKIIRSIDRPVNEMSVDEISKRCGISRQTFYRYFKTKDDMLHWYHYCCRGMTVGEVGRSLTWLEAYTQYYSLLLKEPVFNHFVVQRNDLHEETVRHCVEMFRLMLQIKNKNSLSKNMEYAILGQSVLDVRFTADWIKEEMATPVDEIAQYVVECIPRILLDALQK